MTPTLAATLNGAFACTLVLFGLIAAVLSVWNAWLKRRGRRAERERDAELRRGLANNGERK